MRALWKGAISFGLINIPIALYSATRREELSFRLLRASDHSPVNYKRVAEADGKEVPWDQIVKGYEYEKDRFVVLKEDDFRRVDIEATQTVDIIDFVPLAEINPMFFHKPFYMEPTKVGAKAYALLREALSHTKKVGVAKVVIKTRQHLAAVKPNESGLLLELMHFANELVEPDALHFPGKVDFNKGELDMARTLIERMTDKWNPARYKDEYRSALMELIEEKIAKGGKAPATRAKPPGATNVIDLMDVLKKSIADTQKQTQRPRPKRSSKAALKKAA